MKTYSKTRRAKSIDDFEIWVESDVSCTVNLFDMGGARATTVIVEDSDAEGNRNIEPRIASGKL